MTPAKLLSKGSKIAIVATARFVDEKDVEFSVRCLEKMGFTPVYDERLFAVCGQFAGDDDFRSATLQSYIDDPEIEAILCARGGYGTVRIIDKINFDKFLLNPKWIIGYSDVTALHAKLQSMNCESLHATMPINFSDNTETSLKSFYEALTKGNITYEIDNATINIKGEAEGELVGGNISVLYSLLGSSSFPNTDGKILFLEDLDEYLYHIDRMMMAFKRAGKLDNIKGLIVGALTKMHDNTIPFGKDAEHIIFEYVKDKGIPVCFNFPAGHIDDNRSLIFGRKTKLKIEETSIVEMY